MNEPLVFLATETQAAWHDTCSSDLTNTCPSPHLHHRVKPTESHFDNGHCVAGVDALLRHFVSPLAHLQRSVPATEGGEPQLLLQI